VKSRFGILHTLGKEEPINDGKYLNCINRNDESHGPIEMSISLHLRFHLQGIDSPDEALKTLQVVFGKHNIIQSHH